MGRPSPWIAGVLAGLIGLTTLPTARAHTKRTHHALVDLAFQYLQHHATLPAELQAFDPAEVTDALAWYQALPIASDGASPQEQAAAWAMLGLDVPGAAISGGDVAGVKAPKYDSPGLATVLNDIGSDNFLGYCAAHVDELADVWVSAPSIWKKALEKTDAIIDEKLAGITGDWHETVGDAFDEWREGCHDAFPSTWDFLFGITWFLRTICKVLASVVEAVAHLGIVLVHGALALFLWLANADAETARGFLMGCPNATWQQELIADLAGGLVELDKPIWNGVPAEDCHVMATWLPYLENFKLYEGPTKLSDISSIMQQRMRHYWDVCQANDWAISGASLPFTPVLSPPAGSCFGHLNEFFSNYPHHVVAGQKPYYEWHGLEFTSMTHFLDLFSPAGSDLALDFRDPLDESTVANRVLRGLEIGSKDDVDGFSVGDGVGFATQVGLTAAGQPTSDVLESAVDDKLATQAHYFGSTIAWRESGHLYARRRVNCDDGPLVTSDGMAGSVCDATGHPGDYTHRAIPLVIHAPADNAALEGFSAFLESRYPLISDRTPAWLPFTDIGPAYTDPCSQTGSLDCTAQIANKEPEQQIAAGDIPAMRLYGLAISVHMLGDMTTPQHLAPTLGFGHSYYESFVEYSLYKKPEVCLLSVEADAGSLTFTKATAVPPGLCGPVVGAADAPDAWKSGCAGAAWTPVAQGISALRQVMGLMANEACPADAFSMRRLTNATALITAKVIQDANPTIVESPFWMHGAAIQNHLDGDHLDALGEASGLACAKVGTPEFQRVADATLPVAVGAIAIALIRGYRAAKLLDDGGSIDHETCDRGWRDPTGTITSGLEVADDNGDCIAEAAAAQKADGVPGPLALSRARCLCAHKEGQALEACVEDDQEVYLVNNLLTFGFIDQFTASSHYRGGSDDDDDDRRRRPTHQGPADSDGDGIPDASDACPNEAVPHVPAPRPPIHPLVNKLGDEGAYGCVTDADGDGVADVVDRCVSQSGGAVDERGCSEADYAARLRGVR